MILTIDTGGTKTFVAIFSPEGQLLEKLRFETPKDYPVFLEELKNAIRGYAEKYTLTACAIGMPGRIDIANGSVLAFGNLPWKNIKIVQDLNDVLENIPIYLLNDSKLAGLAAALQVPEYKRALYVTVSTGIGTCFVVDGRIDAILANSEAGQAEIEYNGSLQKWEDFASGRAIVATYGKRASEIEDPAIWKEIAHKICLGLFELIALLQPDVIIFGGGVGAHLDKFREFIEAELEEHPNPMVSCPVILQALNAEEAVLFGGFAYSLQQTQQSSSL